mgnify:FL=1
MERTPKVLIIPLDWGLGHATRCIPIIHYMQSKGWEINLAGEGAIADLLSKEFPDVPLLPLKGYRITYPKKGWFFIPKIIIQIPKIIQAIIHEHKWLKKHIQTHHWNLIVSDNRYGLFTQYTKTILITHQVSPHTGFGKMMDTLLRKVIYQFIRRFDACWVPDTADDQNISGNLSHVPDAPKNLHYVGPISRLNSTNRLQEHYILILLSGPEPQRSILEKILIEQAIGLEEKFVLVRGLPSAQDERDDLENIQFINHVSAEKLAVLIEQSKMIICRTGYSTVMDLLKLKKRGLMIPTPGQTEQEYLGKRMKYLTWYVVQDQGDIDLEKGIAKCLGTPRSFPNFDFDAYKKQIDYFGIQYFGV